MLRKLLHNLNTHFWDALIGLGIAIIGVDLWTNEHYFFWPPQYTTLMNDDRIDAMAVLIGVGLIIYALIGKNNNTILGIFLGLSVAFMTLIAIAFWIHMTFARQSMLSIPLTLAIVFIIAILRVAFNHNTKD
ncbi:MAG: hypothetical protein HDR41_00200 [Lactobacillus sp.]|nr:hypothetical protein [Lactobacillus sp.]